MSVDENKTNKTDNVGLHRPPHFDPSLKLHNSDMAILDAFLGHNIPIDKEPTTLTSVLDLNSSAYLESLTSGYEYYYGHLEKFAGLPVDIAVGGSGGTLIIRTIKFHEEEDDCTNIFQFLIATWDSKVFYRYATKFEGSAWTIGSWQILLTNGTILDHDGAGSGIDADLLDGREGFGFAKSGSASGNLITTADPNEDANTKVSIYKFTDTNGTMPEGGVNLVYTIIQRYALAPADNTRLAISNSSGKVYVETKNQTWRRLSYELRPMTAEITTDSELGTVLYLNLEENIHPFDEDILSIHVTANNRATGNVKLTYMVSNHPYHTENLVDVNGNTLTASEIPTDCLIKIGDTGTGIIPTLLNSYSNHPLYTDFNDVPKKTGTYFCTFNATHSPLSISSFIWVVQVYVDYTFGWATMVASIPYHSGKYYLITDLDSEWADAGTWATIKDTPKGIYKAKAFFANDNGDIATSSNDGTRVSFSTLWIYIYDRLDDLTFQEGDIIFCELKGSSSSSSSATIKGYYKNVFEEMIKTAYSSATELKTIERYNDTGTAYYHTPLAKRLSKMLILRYKGNDAWELLNKPAPEVTVSTSAPSSNYGVYGDLWCVVGS